MKGPTEGSGFRFRISDVYEVPHRGTMLRLKLLEGSASMKALRPGSVLRVAPASGGGRRVTIKDIGLTAGRPSQERLERTQELDILVSAEDAAAGEPVRIGWEALPDRSGR